MSALTNSDYLAANRKRKGTLASQFDAQLADNKGWTITRLEPERLDCTRDGVTIEAHYCRATNNVIRGEIRTGPNRGHVLNVEGNGREQVRDALVYGAN